MKIYKKLQAIFSSMLLAISFNCFSLISVNATDAGTTFTIQEYEKIISAEADKYNIEIEILDYDDSVAITEDTISHGIESLENFYLSQRIVEIEQDSFDKLDSGFEVMTMPVNRTRSAGYYVYNVYGSCVIYAEVYAKVDLQNGAIMNIYSATSYQSGEFINFAGWTQTSISTIANNPGVGYVKTTVSGRATFQYADPVTAITTGYTSTERFTVNVYMS